MQTHPLVRRAHANPPMSQHALLRVQFTLRKGRDSSMVRMVVLFGLFLLHEHSNKTTVLSNTRSLATRLLRWTNRGAAGMQSYFL